MKKKTVKVISIHPQAEPRFVTINNDYHDMQALVGGFMSCSRLADDLSVYYNDEGLLEGLPPNVRTATGALLVGSLFVSREDDEGGSIDVTDADMELVRTWLQQCERPARFVYGNYDAIIVSGETGDMDQLHREMEAASAKRGGVTIESIWLGGLSGEATLK